MRHQQHTELGLQRQSTMYQISWQPRSCSVTQLEVLHTQTLTACMFCKQPQQQQLLCLCNARLCQQTTQVLPHSDDFWNLHPKRTLVILLPPSRVETIWRRFSWLLRQVCILPCPCLHLHLFFLTVQKTSSRQGKDTWAQWFQYTTIQICCWQGRDITLKTTTTKTKKYHCCMALNQSIKPVTNNRLPKRPPPLQQHLMKQIKFLILNYKINYISMSYSTDINLQHE